jgi:hypothetical protein
MLTTGQKFVIDGYTPAPRAFDALIFGYYQDGNCCTLRAP